MIPAYLQPPPTSGLHLHGTVDYDVPTNSYRLLAEPAVLELAKRVFPGCVGRKIDGITFKATRRAAGDLNWLLLRFPMEIRCPERFEADRRVAIEHAGRREGNIVVPAVMDPPGFKGKLEAYQGDGVAFLMANPRTLLADDPGLGKTVMALAGLASGNLFPALIVPPPNITVQWKRMAEFFLSLSRPPRILEGLKPTPLGDAQVYIAHYGILRGWKDTLLAAGFKAVIFDEVQELRRPESQKYSICSLLSSEVEFAWGLSGTPIYNYGGEIWSVMNALEFQCLGDFESFTREWCTGYRSSVIEKPDILGAYLRSEGLMIRRLKADVQGQLPPKRRVVTYIGYEDDKYGKLIRDAVALSKQVEHTEEWTERGRMVRRIQHEARRATGVAKAPMVADFARTLLEAGERVLLFAYHHDVHEILSEKLADFKPVRITGNESRAEKDAAVKTFAEAGTNLVIISLRTSAGLDGLQGRGTCVIFGELDWSPAVHTQCEDRLQRIGAKAESILCYYLVTDTGSDEVMQEALGLKIGQFIGIMGDTPESDTDRQLAGQAAQRHLEGIVKRLKERHR